MVASVEGDDGVPPPQETAAPSDAATARTLTRRFLDGMLSRSTARRRRIDVGSTLKNHLSTDGRSVRARRSTLVSSTPRSRSARRCRFVGGAGARVSLRGPAVRWPREPRPVRAVVSDGRRDDELHFGAAYGARQRQCPADDGGAFSHARQTVVSACPQIV